MEDNTAWARIERSFDAPIAQVWDMWTQPEKFQQWYGPMGATLPVCEMDLTVGGIRKTCMEMQMGDRTMQMWFTGVFKEINAPKRLVYTEAMCDADGNLLPPSAMGMPGDTPNITEVIVDLRADGDTTHMTMVHKGVPEGSPGEKGWGMAIDKLEAVLG